MIDNVYVLIIIAMVGTFILVISFVLILLRNQNKLLNQREKLQQAELKYQKEILRSMIESQEAERRRIGQDLHDDVGTALSNLRITIERFSREPPTEETFVQLKVISKSIIDKVINDVRNISHNLSPEILSVNSTSEAIEELCDFINNSGKLSVYLTNEGDEILDAFPLMSALSIYRVLEELITNTIKHAEATVAEISIVMENDRLVINYKDNGKGLPAIEKLKKGRGLQNIESRLGIIQAVYILQNAGGGYHMEIKIPVSIK